VRTGRASARKRKISLGRSAFRIAGGAKVAVKVRLSRRNQRLLKRIRKARVLAIIVARDEAGNTQTTRQALALKAAASRARR
jgi:hypothetical protein